MRTNFEEGQPSPELSAAIVEIKCRNPRFGCRRIAQQLSLTFDITVEKDVVRRVLAQHYQPTPGSHGASWLTFLGHTKDSLWSVDLFRCESLTIKSHWVMVVMDQFTRRIIGFAVHSGAPDGVGVCRMFNDAIAGVRPLPSFLSTDNDPLFRYQRWRANLRIIEVSEVKTVPYVPLSHPFVERLIGTIRRELLDHVPFWNSVDLRKKLDDFKAYYNDCRAHHALGGRTPNNMSKVTADPKSGLGGNLKWESHCSGLFQLPIAA